MKQSNPDFQIILESSLVYSRGSRVFLSHSLSAAIKDLAKVRDVRVFWYLPEAVRMEREFQMITAADQQLNEFRGIERLLGTDFKVSKDDLASAIGNIIERTIADHSLSVIKLDPSRVDWLSLIRDAIFRNPPFQVGDKEKGFRDAIIIETCLQHAEKLPTKDPDCRIVFLANDDLMVVAAEKRAEKIGKNFSVVRRLTELSSTINAVPAHLSMTEIRDILSRAASRFYQRADEDTLYYSAKVNDQIRVRFGSELARRLEDISKEEPVEFVNVDIGAPTFLAKNGDILQFSTVVAFNFRVGLLTANTVWFPGTTSPIISAFGNSLSGPIIEPSSGVILTGPTPFAGTSITGLSGAGGNTSITGPFGGGTSPFGIPFGNTSVSITNSTAITGANTSSITFTSSASRMLSYQLDVRWRAKLAPDKQLVEAELEDIEAIQPDW